MNLIQEMTEILSLEQWAARLPQMVAENNKSAKPMARIVTRQYNQMFELYPITERNETKAQVNMTPRLVRK